MKKTLLIIILALLGLTGGFFAKRLLDKPLPQSTQATHETPGLAPAFTLNDLHDQPHASSEWQGKVRMINFWASWCPPCVREIPAFIKLQEAYKNQGLVIIGIALDNKQSVIDFTDPLDINYPILMAQKAGIPLAKAYGNRLGVLPYTVIVDKDGNIIYTHRGELTYNVAEEVIKPLL